MGEGPAVGSSLGTLVLARSLIVARSSVVGAAGSVRNDDLPASVADARLGNPSRWDEAASSPTSATRGAAGSIAGSAAKIASPTSARSLGARVSASRAHAGVVARSGAILAPGRAAAARTAVFGSASSAVTADEAAAVAGIASPTLTIGSTASSSSSGDDPPNSSVFDVRGAAAIASHASDVHGNRQPAAVVPG